MRIFILLTLLLILSQCKLVYFAELFRHGARYPLGDLWDGINTKQFHGQLTSIGKRQQYLLGNYLRADYIDKLKFANSTLNPAQIQVFTDSSQRCIQSAYAHLAGMFPLGSGPSIPDGIDSKYLDPPFDVAQNLKTDSDNGEFALMQGYQPVPVKNGNFLFPSCPNEANIMIRRGEALAKIFAQFQLQQAVFTQKMRLVFSLPLNMSNLAGLAELYDVVVCDQYLGRPTPADFTQSDAKQLEFIQSYLFMSVFGGQPGRIFSTPIITEVVNNMQKIIKGNFNLKKMSIYSGHDSNVVPLLSFFNLSSPECIKKRFKNETVTGNCAIVIPFASNLIFELHLSDSVQNSYFVKIRYNGKYFNLCEKESTECAFDEFNARVRQRVVDFKKQCGIK